MAMIAVIFPRELRRLHICLGNPHLRPGFAQDIGLNGEIATAIIRFEKAAVLKNSEKGAACFFTKGPASERLSKSIRRK